MPPPGAIPPGYAYEHIPPRYMQKKPLPAGADNNVRPYTIFFSYLLLCFSLAVFIISKLFQSHSILSKSTTARTPPRKHVQYFTLLAIGSLGTTWYHMFRYFQTSYRTWFMWRSIYELSPDQMHWGLWLRDTSLFREAWETVILGAGRYWWSQQIFFFACALGLYMEQRGMFARWPRNCVELTRLGIRRGIKHTWAFMLLGQVVAISFATNLFLLAVLLSPPAPPPPSSTGIHRRRWFGPWLVNLLTVVATVLPAYWLGTEDYYHTPEFMTVLLIPHVALLVMPFARAVLPSKYLTDAYVDFAENVYKYLWGTTIVSGILLELKTTLAVHNWNGLSGTWHALFEHPAVSSVGFDVIFCWITWTVWWKTQSHSSDNALADEQLRNEANWISAGSGTGVVGGDSHSGEVRRR
jgi:hypothetical protein